MRRRRCEGVTVREVKGLNQNVPCGRTATTTRALGGEGKKELHFCAEHAREHDEQQKLLEQMIG